MEQGHPVPIIAGVVPTGGEGGRSNKTLCLFCFISSFESTNI